MATGDIDDMSLRLQALIPNGWFTAGLALLRDAVLRGAATTLAFVFSLLVYVRTQTRIATATDGFLDMISFDFFGSSLPRVENQTDASYRARIIANLFRERGTRNAVTLVLTQLTGRAPIIFEPARPADTGGYSMPSSGYGVAGGYGSLLLPRQAFVTAFRPARTGAPSVAGYGISTFGYSQPARGEYASISDVQGLSDDDIFAAIDSVRPIGCRLWARISN